MNKVGGQNIAIDNSFTLNFRNTTSYTQQVTLFKEGLTGYESGEESIVKEVFGATNVSFPTSAYPPPNWINWNNPFNNPFEYFNNPLLTNLTQYPTINDVTWKGGVFLLQLISADAIDSVNVNLVGGESIAQINSLFEQAFANLPSASGFRNSEGQTPSFEFTFNESVWRDNYNLPINLFGIAQQPFGFNLTYPYPNQLPTNKLISIFLVNATGYISNINSIPLSLRTEANGVVITDYSNIKYEEILQSQNGSAYDIESLVLNLGSGRSLSEKASQLLQPFKFAKRDVNGNETDYVKNQLIDPYQDQFSYSRIDLVSEENGENYILDGNTAFIYRIEPFTSVNLTFNYRRVTNLTFQTEEGSKTLEQEGKNLKALDNKTEFAEIKVIDNIQEEKYSNFLNSNDKKNSKSKFIYLLGGILAIYYLLTKTNQK
jgi:hypothetical protein